MHRHSLAIIPGLCTIMAAGLASAAQDQPPPLFGDWHYLMPEGWRDSPRSQSNDPCDTVPRLNYTETSVFMPVNQPGGGHGGPQYGDGRWMNWFANCFATHLDEAGAPIGLIIRNRNCPFPYAADGRRTTPHALADALDNLPKLDYLILDLEAWDDTGYAIVELNANEIVRLVRSHPNPRIANAYIGNYGDSPNRTDEATIFPRHRDRTVHTSGTSAPFDRHAFYHSNFNLAMPVAYPLEIFSRHSDADFQGGNATPNDRAAIFWGPLERVSAAARDLPEGDLLMPWMSNYVKASTSGSNYHAPAPPMEDIEALSQHVRMRGAKSFVIWTSSDGNTHHPYIDYDVYRSIALGAWDAIDPIFEMTRTVEFVNLETEKTSPVQWSAVRAGSTIQILISNLDASEPRKCELPFIGGLPAYSPEIGPGEHLLMTVDIDPAVRDFNADGTVNNDDFLAFVMSMMQGEASYPNAVGGSGGDWRDLNSDGMLDLRDLIQVATARVTGAFESYADDRRSGFDDLGGLNGDK